MTAENASLRIARRLAAALLLWVFALHAAAQGVDVNQLVLSKSDGEVTIDFAARVTLPKAVDEALQRGVPMYFVAQASLMRHRWYWRDERVARAVRTWRLSYQPLTASWRVSLGGLHQTYSTLAEALTAASRTAHWKIADASQVDPDDRYYVEFGYRLDTAQLPRPMQIGIGIGGQGDWAIETEHILRLE